MDHAVGSATGTTAGGGRQRPGWWWTIGNLLLAAILSVAVVAVVVLPLAALHVIPDAVGPAGAWPWRRTDVWAIVAGLGPLLLIGYGFAYATRFVVSARGDWNVRLWPIALMFAVCAVLPVGQPEDQGGDAGFWLVLLIVVRYWAVTREPVDVRWPRRAWLAVGAAVLLLAAATLSYQPLHPLTIETASLSASGDRRPATSQSFTLDVEGIAGARILSATVSEYGRPGPLDYVVKLDDRVLGRQLPQGTTVSGSIEISPAFCRRGWASVRPENLTVRLRVLGRERTQQLSLASEQAISCPRRR